MALDLEQGSLVVDGRSIAVAGLQDAVPHRPRHHPWSATTAATTSPSPGARADLSGGDGRDRLANVYDYYFESYTFDCRDRRLQISGGPGADRLPRRAGHRLAGR